MTRSRPRRHPLAAWALYDWANSAFAAIVSTFVFPAYFERQVAPDVETGSVAWSFTVGIVGVAVAVLGPVLGAIADQGGRRKPWLVAFTGLAVAATAALWFVRPEAAYFWPALWLVGLATLASEFAFIFYNAMLPDLAQGSRLGRWSGWAWGVGYAGGLLCLIVALLVLVRVDTALIPLERSSAEHVRATFVLAAVWYLAFALPLVLWTPDLPSRHRPWRGAIQAGLRQLRESVREVRRYGHIVRFLIARMFFIDGLATVFALGGIYAAGMFAMSEEQVLLFGIGLNVTAGLGAAAFAWLDDRLGSRRTVLLSLIGLIAGSSAVLAVSAVQWFWVFGLAFGFFVGPVQSAGRTYLAHTAPAPLRTQMFGLFALSGKATAFVGPLTVGWLTALSGSLRVGMITVVALFVIGFVLMLGVPNERDPAVRQA